MENKQKNNTLTIILLVIICILICVVGWLVGSKIIDRNQTNSNRYNSQTQVDTTQEKNNQQEVKIETLAVDGELAQTLNDYLSYNDLAGDEIVNEIKLDNLSNKELLEVALKHIEGDVIVSQKQCQDKVYSESKIRDEIEKLFGKRVLDFSQFNNFESKVLNTKFTYNRNAMDKTLTGVTIKCLSAVVTPELEENLKRAEIDSNKTVYLYKELKYTDVDADSIYYETKYTYKENNGKYYFESLKVTKQ